MKTTRFAKLKIDRMLIQSDIIDLKDYEKEVRLQIAEKELAQKPTAQLRQFERDINHVRLHDKRPYSRKLALALAFLRGKPLFSVERKMLIESYGRNHSDVRRDFWTDVIRLARKYDVTNSTRDHTSEVLQWIKAHPGYHYFKAIRADDGQLVIDSLPMLQAMDMWGNAWRWLADDDWLND